MNTDVLQILEFTEIQKRLAAHAPSALSKELALSWRPSVYAEVIERLLAETDEAVRVSEREIATPLGETHDLRDMLSKAEKDVVLLPPEFTDLAATLETYEKMSHYFTGERAGLYPVLAELAGLIHPEETLLSRIRRVFGDHGEIADNASPKLARIRQEKASAKSRIRRAFEQILQDKDQAGFFRDAIITQRSGRYVLPVKAEYRYKFNGIVHDRSSTGQTLFMEPMASVVLNNDLAELEAAEKQEIAEILRGLTKDVQKETRNIRESMKLATQIELIFARAALSAEMHGVRALADDKGRAKLIGARHPLLDPKTAVPLTLSLGGDYRQLIITGSNAGGKTIAMKTLGLLALMNQAGLFIPAAEGSRLPVYRHIYAVIGDEQSIMDNLSTFSGYITQLAGFIEKAGAHDLVLLDELGSGTDPIEGAALAESVTEFLARRGIPAIITSHFSEMKKLAYETDGIENAFVEFDEKTLAPTYRLITGMAGNSNAFNICRRFGMTDEILTRAEALKEKSPLNEMETLMADLNRELSDVQKERDMLAEKVKEAETLRNELAEADSLIKEKKRAIFEKAREEAENMKRDIRIQAETIIKELKKKAAEADKENLPNEFNKARKQIEDIALPKKDGDRAPIVFSEMKEGDFVYVDTLQSVGCIEKIAGRKLTVQCGNFRITVTPEHCFMPTKKETPKKKVSASGKEFVNRATHGRSIRAIPTEINIIGKTVDEAIPDVDRFLNDAFMAGVSPVEIIHGKGTGALRRGIHEYLKTLNFVTEFHLADERSGGAGATEVYF